MAIDISSYKRATKAPKMPNDLDLKSGLKLMPEKGEIRLGGQRMMMMHLSAFASFRSELLSALGYRAARTLITRIGYVAGASDGEWARSIRPELSEVERFAVGPQLHALEGIVAVKPVEMEVDIENGKHYGEFIWENSIEDAAVKLSGEDTKDSACWMQMGYASGHTSAFMGLPVLYREVECQSQGYPHCRIIGKPVTEWDDPEEDLSYMQFTTSNLISEPRRSVHPVRRPTLDPSSLPNDPLRMSATTAPIVGASSGFETALHKVARCAPTDVTVLIEGESGTGKERFAQLIHKESLRALDPFVSVNCAAMPGNLIEAELFGVEKGAYTGADKARAGRFERAHTGTIFLDEIGIMPLSAQATLLRVLQDKVVERIGGSKPIEVDVRIIAATNVDLREAVKKGTFRQDLLYRLNVFNIKLPALRSRVADIPILINHFIEIFSKKYNKHITGMGRGALNLLMKHSYPGNIRELQNIIERTVIMADEGTAISRDTLVSVNEQLLPDPVAVSSEPVDDTAAGSAFSSNGEAIEDLALRSGKSFAELEQAMLQRAVEMADGNLSEAARRLGITRPQLAYRLSKSNA